MRYVPPGIQAMSSVRRSSACRSFRSISIPGNVMTLTSGVRFRPRFASCASCLCTANFQRKIPSQRAKPVRTFPRIESKYDTYEGSAIPLQCDVQFVPICDDVACSLNVKFPQSINALLQCMSLCLKIRRNLLRADSASCVTATTRRAFCRNRRITLLSRPSCD
jgi:hypothetical protein